VKADSSGVPLHLAYIALGANLADPERQVIDAFKELAALPRTALLAKSALYRTAAVGGPQQPDYINACAAIETALDPAQLLTSLFSIEKKHGRVRSVANAPRTLDLDLLLYADRIIDQPGLVVPHPRLHERAFVLIPLAEIAPQMMVPGHGKVADLAALHPPSGVTKLHAA
jgi:2-amino-4-hydroxy-6-hydroxymethyldihydropteridine diphosphokinase